MVMAKRIFLFLAVNILIVATLSLVMGVLGIAPYLSSKGIHYKELAIFCLIWGFGGAFISLGLSRIMAKWMMGVRLIDPNTPDPELRWLVTTVNNLARKAGLPKDPQVGIYESDEVNAFATGPTKSRALVAVSTGLLGRMDRHQAEGVLGHEVAHVANGDMVTMTLIQGVVNAFVMFLARVIAFLLGQNVKEESRPMVHFLTVLVLDILLGFLGAMVVFYFSRVREFRADLGGAKLAGKEKMIGALVALQKSSNRIDSEHQAMATLKISGKTGGMLAKLMASHPPLEDRIARLQSDRT